MAVAVIASKRIARETIVASSPGHYLRLTDDALTRLRDSFLKVYQYK